jgi:hypothetical protein
VLRSRIALALLSTAAVVRAEPASSEAAVHLSWIRSSTAVSCPDAGHVQADVVRRLGRNPFGEPSHVFVEASVSKDGATWRAEIEMRDAGGASLGSRRVSSDGPTCASLGAAAGLAIALMIDPDALLEPRPAPPPAEVAPPETPARPAPVEPAPARRGTLVLSVLGAGRILPGAAFGARLAGDLRLSDRLDLGVASTFLPDRRQSREGNEVSFGLFWGSLGPCYRFVDTPHVSSFGCASLLFGVLRTGVFDPVRARTGALPWAGASAGVRLGWSPVSPLRFEGAAELIAPFYRRNYLVERAPGDNVAVFSDPVVGAAGFVGVGVQY